MSVRRPGDAGSTSDRPCRARGRRGCGGIQWRVDDVGGDGAQHRHADRGAEHTDQTFEHPAQEPADEGGHEQAEGRPCLSDKRAGCHRGDRGQDRPRPGQASRRARWGGLSVVGVLVHA